MSEIDLYHRALQKYGAAFQLNMVIEECAECITAINHWRRGKCSGEEMVSEMVDVSIMLEQMKRIATSEGNCFDVQPDYWTDETLNKLMRLERNFNKEKSND